MHHQRQARIAAAFAFMAVVVLLVASAVLWFGLARRTIVRQWLFGRNDSPHHDQEEDEEEEWEIHVIGVGSFMLRLVAGLLASHAISIGMLQMTLLWETSSSSWMKKITTPTTTTSNGTRTANSDTTVVGVSDISPLAVQLSCAGMASTSITGLVFVVLALILQEPLSCKSLGYWLLIVGILVLILSCASLMISFWPPSTTITTATTAATTTTTTTQVSRNSANNQSGLNDLPSTAAVSAKTTHSVGCYHLDQTNLDVVYKDDNDNYNDTSIIDPLRVPLLGDRTTILDHDDEEAARGDDDNLQVPSSLGPTHQSVASGTDTHQLENEAVDPSTTTTTGRLRGTRRLLQLATSQVLYLYAGCVVLLIRLPFSLAIPHFVSTTLSALSRRDFSTAQHEILALLVLGTVDAMLDFWCVFLFGYANQRIVRGVRTDLFATILRQEVAFFDTTSSGELASRLNSDCSEMAGDLTWFFRFSIESVVRITGITTYMLIRCPLLGACALSIIPVVAMINKSYGHWLSHNAIQVQTSLAAANAVAQEALANIRTVITFAAESQECTRYEHKIDNYYQLNLRQLFMTGVYYMAVSTFLINTIVQGTLLWIGTQLIRHNHLSADVLLAFMLYQGQLQNETMNLFQSYSSLIKSSGAGDKVFALLDRIPMEPGTGSPAVQQAVAAAASPHINGDGNQRTNGGTCHQQEVCTGCTGSNIGPLSSSIAPVRSTYHIELRDVSFSYPSRPEQVVLNHFNLNIPYGKTLALVGSSGGGKSTVINLLQRFYDPTEGAVLVHGVDLRQLDLRHHRQQMGVVTQDPTLFIGTLRENIVYGFNNSSDIPEEQIIHVTQLANAHDFIQTFSAGYDTHVGERGVQLSGGQKQRIAISRSLLRQPQLLILDEATSALDVASEHAVQEALDRLLSSSSKREQGQQQQSFTCNNGNDVNGHKHNNELLPITMTVIVIAHRLRTVRNADCIAVLHQGQVSEQGTHDELMKIPFGLYRSMVDRAGSSNVLLPTFEEVES